MIGFKNPGRTQSKRLRLCTLLFLSLFSFSNQLWSFEGKEPMLLTISGPENVTCGGTTQTYTVSGTSNAVTWDVLGSGQIIGQSSGNVYSIQVEWFGPGEQAVQVWETGNSNSFPAFLVVNVAGLPAPITTGATGCSDTDITLSANTTVDWYTQASGGTAVHQGNSYTVNLSQTTYYYVEAVDGSCTSERVPVLATVESCGTTPTYNLVRNYSVQEPGNTLFSQVKSETDAANVVRTSNYSDGLGRTIQSVQRGISPTGKDLVNSTEYDDQGRSLRTFLPITTAVEPGTFKTDIETERSAFYQLQYGNAEVASAYSLTETDNSPLNRSILQFQPGADWVGSNAGVSSNYRTNTAEEQIVDWEAGTGEQGVPVFAGYFSQGQLRVSEVTDEDDKSTMEYRDKMDRVILKRVKNVAVADSAINSHWLNTYYVYDDFGNLKTVIPPKAVAQIEGSWVVNAQVSDELLFHYSYDYRNRMVTKKVPGSEVMEMVYDLQDRVVLTREARQVAVGEWTFTKYDVLGRTVMTGAYQSQDDRATLQGLVVAQGQNSALVPIDTAQSEVSAADLFLNAHQSQVTDYNATATITFTEGFDNAGQAFVAEIDQSLNASGSYFEGFVDNSFPAIGDDVEVQSLTFYDNYAFTDHQFDAAYNGQLAGGAHAEAISPVTDVRGLVTGTKTKTFGLDRWTTSVNFYDVKGRTLQVQTRNYLGGQDIQTTAYDFSGRPLNSYTVVQNPESLDYTAVQFKKTQRYDHAGRLLTLTHQHFDDSQVAIGTADTLAAHQYDEIGQLVVKAMGNQTQQVDYDYNIRGWLTGINNPNSNVGAMGGEDYFAMQLRYADGSSALKNGNISEIDWSSAGDNDYKRYEYSYDETNRLLTADYTNQTSPVYDNDFSVSNLSYDENGNILSLSRRGRVLGEARVIDELTYDYHNQGNRLSAVSDTYSAGSGDFFDGFDGTDYTYDASGNLLTDENKKISQAITYNRLNLPQEVVLGNGRSITFRYDASGQKQQKITNDNGAIETTDYLNGFIYKNGALQHYATEEGRVRQNSQGELVFDYYLKDHLGNTRTTFTTEQSPAQVYKATMESEADVNGDNIAAFEAQLFNNLQTVRMVLNEANTSTIATDGCTDCNEVAALNPGQGTYIGPALMLDVMPGDVIDLETWAFYYNNQTAGVLDQTAYLNAFVGAFSPANAGAEYVNQSTSLFGGLINELLGIASSPNPQTPKAYLNYLVLDQHFELVDHGSQQVTDAPGLKQLVSISQIGITTKGYLYVWVSNQTATNHTTYFDDLKVTHQKGPVLQEDHYYPFGMNINALSSTALLMKGNDFRYNGFELQQDFDLNLYDYQARYYDPQLGRFLQTDPAADLMRRHGVYNYAFDNPIRFIDPDGMMPEESTDGTEASNQNPDCNPGDPCWTDIKRFKSFSPMKSALQENVQVPFINGRRNMRNAFSGSMGLTAFSVGFNGHLGRVKLGSVLKLAAIEIEGSTDGDLNLKTTALDLKVTAEVGDANASGGIVLGQSDFDLNEGQFNDTGDFLKEEYNVNIGNLNYTNTESDNSFDLEAAVGFLVFKVKADLNAAGKAVENLATSTGNFFLNLIGGTGF